MKALHKVASPAEVRDYLSTRLLELLGEDKKVLWLLAGGSAIPLEVEVLSELSRVPKIDKLTVTLADERYGPAGHGDSNWQQLISAGAPLGNIPGIPVLRGLNLSQTTTRFAADLAKALEESDYVLLLAGIGADGHTLGIKPHSPAVSSRKLVASYNWDDYNRITATPALFAHIDEAVGYVMGAEKKEQLEKLAKQLPIANQPAQLLKQARRVIIFNDQLEREL